MSTKKSKAKHNKAGHKADHKAKSGKAGHDKAKSGKAGHHGAAHYSDGGQAVDEKVAKDAKARAAEAKAKSAGPGDLPATRWEADPAPLLRVGAGFRLADTETGSTPGYGGKKADGERDLATAAAEVDLLQEKLFANSLGDGPDKNRSLLLVLQGMDSSGKGGIVRHVVGSVDPGGVTHASFKKPTPEELSHDFLWRIRNRVPAAGQIGVFDRSHYEDVLAGRVLNLASPEEIDARYGAINDFEQELVEQGTTVIKVFLNISPDEQRARLADRLDRPDKHWKYNPNDIDTRLLWNQYQEAYQVAFDRTSTEVAPWFVVPADHKWYARLAVQHLVLDALQKLHQEWPPADYDVEVEKARLAAS